LQHRLGVEAGVLHVEREPVVATGRKQLGDFGCTE